MSRIGLTAVLAVLMGLCAPHPASAAPPIEAYGKLPAVERVRLSPSGGRLALIAVIGESRKLVIASMAGKRLATIAVGDNKVDDLTWVGENHLLVGTTVTSDLRVDYGFKYELGAYTIVDIANDRATYVFSKSEAIGHTVFGYYGSAEKGGHWYGYFSGLTYDWSGSPAGVDLYQVDLDSNHNQLLSKTSELDNDTDLDYSWAVGPDGRVLAYSDYSQVTGKWRLSATSGARLMQKVSLTREISLAGLGRTPGTVLVSDQTGEGDVLEEIPVAGGTPQELFADVSTSSLLADPVTGLLIGAVTPQEPGAVFLDPALEARYKSACKAFPGLRVRLASYSADLDQMVVETEGPGDSGTFYLVNLNQHRADAIGQAYPAIAPADVGETSMFKYKAADGLDLEGVLILPPGRDPKALPMVVMPHGGAIGVHDDVGFDWWAQAFASQGYAVLQPNYRGSSGYGAEFRKAGMGQWGRKMLSDISDGVAALAGKGVIDPKRACIVGASYGGYAALAGVTLQQGLYRCAVSVAGPSDMPALLDWQNASDGNRENDATRALRVWTGADQPGGGTLLKSISPAAFAKRADAPILLIHGKDDTIVPIGQSERMSAALKDAGKPAELIELAGQDHWLKRQDTRIATLKASVAFVEAHNPPN